MKAKQAQVRAGRFRQVRGCVLVGALLPLSALAALGALSGAAQQHLVQQFGSGCHNYEDYAGGVQLAMFDPAKAQEDASLTERMIKKLPAGLGPLQDI